MGCFDHLDVAAVTDVGLRRVNNEDAFAVLKNSGVFVVADGMGGGAEGEFASQTTVEGLSLSMDNLMQGQYLPSQDSKCAHIRATCNRVCKIIQKRVKATKADQMGSTVVVVTFDAAAPNKGCVLHAGDSRVYCFRKDQLNLLSEDHSVSAAVGARNENELPVMFRGLLTRAVGLEKEVRLDKTSMDVVEGDILLLCTDGLSRMVSDRSLRSLLKASKNEDPEAIARGLVDAALAAGGRDNVTVLVIKVGALPEPVTVAPLYLPEDKEQDSGPATEIPTADSRLDTEDQVTPTEQHTRTPTSFNEYLFVDGNNKEPPQKNNLFTSKRSWSLSEFFQYGRDVRWFAFSLFVGGLLVVWFIWGWLVGRTAEEYTPSEHSSPSLPTQLKIVSSTIDEDPTPVQISIQALGSPEWKRLDDTQIMLQPGNYRIRFERSGYLSQEKELSFDSGEIQFVEMTPDTWMPGMHLSALMHVETLANASEANLQEIRRELNVVKNHSWTSEYHAKRSNELIERFALLDETDKTSRQSSEDEFSEESAETDMEQLPLYESMGKVQIIMPRQWPEDIPFPTGRLLDRSSNTVAEMAFINEDSLIEVPQGHYVLVLGLEGHEPIRSEIEVRDQAPIDWKVSDYSEWVPERWLRLLNAAQEALEADNTGEAVRLLADINTLDTTDISPVFEKRFNRIKDELKIHEEHQKFLQSVQRADQDANWREVIHMLEEHAEWGNELTPKQRAWMNLWKKLDDPGGDDLADKIYKDLGEWEKVIMFKAAPPPVSFSGVHVREKATKRCFNLHQRIEGLDRTFGVWINLADSAARRSTGPLREGHENYLWILESLRFNDLDQNALRFVNDYQQRATQEATRLMDLYESLSKTNGFYWQHTVPPDTHQKLTALSEYWQGHARLLQGDHFSFFRQRVNQLRSKQYSVKQLKPLTPDRVAEIEKIWEKIRKDNHFESASFNYLDWIKHGGLQDHQALMLLFSNEGDDRQ